MARQKLIKSPWLATQHSLQLYDSATLHRGEPLWKRVPTSDEEGRPLSDFMMLIPKLGSQPTQHIQHTFDEIQLVFDHYRHAVVFADLNLRLNLLWVTVKPIPGICLELPTALKSRVPEAMLVATQPDAMAPQSFWQRRR